MKHQINEGVSQGDVMTGDASRGTVSRPLPRYRRDPDNAPGVVLTSRDTALLEDVWRFRFLTTSQFETLRACDEKEERRFVSRLTLTRRLKLLFHHRYLRRIARPRVAGSGEPVYVLDVEGARTLSRTYGEVTARAPSRLPKAAALDHLLEVVQVSVALTAASFASKEQQGTSALQSSDFHLVEWLGGERVRFRVALEGPGQRRQTVSLIPDAGIVVRADNRRHYAFVEVDRGTEPQRTLAAKCRAYAAYWKEGGFAHDFSVPRGLGFWVLFVAPSPRRAQTIMKAIGTLEGESEGLRMMFRVGFAVDMVPDRIAGSHWLDGANGHPCRFYEVTDLK